MTDTLFGLLAAAVAAVCAFCGLDSRAIWVANTLIVVCLAIFVAQRVTRRIRLDVERLAEALARLPQHGVKERGNLTCLDIES